MDITTALVAEGAPDSRSETLSPREWATIEAAIKDHRSPLAKARDEWLESAEGQSCSEPDILKYPCQRQYLENRLERAFIAGANWMERRQSGADGHAGRAVA